MLALPDDAVRAPVISVSHANFGFYPMATDQARLARRGASFQGIVDQVRIELATRYLRNSQLTASEISERLHFADSTAFSRFMKTKAGVTPSEIRRTR